MKPYCSSRHKQGLTLIEVFVVILLLAIIAALLLPKHVSIRQVRGIVCINNLKEISLATQIWEGNHHDLNPMNVSSTNGGAMEQSITGNVAAVFQVMSNELSIPRILVCPADEDHCQAVNFSGGLATSNISYFISVSAATNNPQMLLFGDDNFEIDGLPIKSGLWDLTTNQSFAWTRARHNYCGNVALADGTVKMLDTAGLENCIKLATNRIAVP